MTDLIWVEIFFSLFVFCPQDRRLSHKHTGQLKNNWVFMHTYSLNCHVIWVWNCVCFSKGETYNAWVFMKTVWKGYLDARGRMKWGSREIRNEFPDWPLNRHQFDWIIKSRRMKWTGCIKEREFQYESLNRKLNQNWENNIKRDVKEIVCVWGCGRISLLVKTSRWPLSFVWGVLENDEIS
jgi:hypothetical protein